MLSHLALALAGLCLAAAEWYHVPEVVPGVVIYLMLVGTSWRMRRRLILPGWAVNLLGGALAVGVGAWFWLATPHPPIENLRDLYASLSEAFLEVGFIPYLGPLLMGLLLLRLFRPVRRDDFWLLQGLGLLQVALGCVLDNGLPFGACLLAYLVAALCAVAAHEREAQARHAVEVVAEPPRWGLFALRWVLGLAALVAGMFLIAPRVEESTWQPSARFGPAPQSARTGFSDLINLNRPSSIEPDDSVAFTVAVTALFNERGQAAPVAVSADQRWRGLVLDRYEEGVWRSDLAWPGAGPVFRTGAVPSGPGDRHFAFEVPRSTGSLFLAEPLRLGEHAGEMPVWRKSRERGPVRLFFEAGGTAIPLNYLNEPTYRYHQAVQANLDPERTPGVRLSDDYLRRLLVCRVRGLDDWTAALLLRLKAVEPAALQGRERLGWSLPPRAWEPVARALADHLAHSGEYAYDLNNTRSGAEPDPVLDFLIHERRGSCERYASGLALMLRSVKIPARVVKGYRGAEHRGDGLHHVLQSHAHAWVEALAPARSGDGNEWLTLDPTPAHEAPAGSEWAHWWQQQQRSGQGLWRELIGYGSRQQADLYDGLTSGELLWRLSPLLGLLAGAALIVWLARNAARGWARRARGVAGLCGRLRAVALRLGVEPRRGQTPQELAEESAARLRQVEATAALAGAPGEVVALYYRSRYGGQEASADEVAAVERRLAELERALPSGGR